MPKELKEKINQDLDFANEIFNRGVIEGTKHSVPSPETKEKLKEFEEKMIHQDRMLEELKKFTDSFNLLLEHSRERDKKVDEMYQVFTNGSFLVTVVKWGFATLLAMGGGYLMIKQIINHE